jgi:hypothetical protein
VHDSRGQLEDVRQSLKAVETAFQQLKASTFWVGLLDVLQSTMLPAGSGNAGAPLIPTVQSLVIYGELHALHAL